MANYQKIDKLRKYDGWKYLIDHFRREADLSLESAITTTDEKQKIRYLNSCEVYRYVISFLEREPLDNGEIIP